MKLSEVNENPGGVVFHVLGVLCAMVRVIPLVGWEEKLHQHIGDVGVGENLVISRIQGDRRQTLKEKAQKMLENKNTKP
jgi:hypothetical protein